MISAVSDLAGQSVLITGGGSGIGAGTADYLVARGAKVTICGRRLEKVEAVADRLGPACLAVGADITDSDARERLVALAVDHGGGLDALVNNAGNMYRGALVTLSEAQLVEVFHNNVIAAMMLSSLCVEQLAKRQGSIIFLGSIHNRRAFPGVSPYAATKGAIESLTKSLAAELGPQGIRVNCVAPGAVFTEINQRAGWIDETQARARLEEMGDIHALGRIGEVSEIAQAITYLIQASWTTGAILDVDGGLGLGSTKQ